MIIARFENSQRIVVVSVNNSGLDQLVAAVESISPTQCVISVGKIANQGAPAGERWTDAGEAHAHSPGNFAAAAHDHAQGCHARDLTNFYGHLHENMSELLPQVPAAVEIRLIEAGLPKSQKECCCGKE